jgi:hypothetical protein
MVEPTFFPNEVSPAPPPPSKKQPVDADVVGRVSKNVNSLAANLRILEERYATLRNKSQVSEQGIISLEKEVRSDIKMLSGDVLELKRDINDIKDKLRLIGAELKNLVNKDEFRVMERYLDMWQPMNFVTRNELNKLLEQKEKEKNQ